MHARTILPKKKVPSSIPGAYSAALAAVCVAILLLLLLCPPTADRRSASWSRPRRFAARRLGLALGDSPLGVSVSRPTRYSCCKHTIRLIVDVRFNVPWQYHSAYPGTALPKRPSAAPRTNQRTLLMCFNSCGYSSVRAHKKTFLNSFELMPPNRDLPY